MIKIFTILLFLMLVLDARENPFFPSSGEADIPMSSNQLKVTPSLKRVSLTLPSTVRTIESVTIKYKNLDGSIVDRVEEVQKSIDWHLPIFISQNYGDSSSREVKKSVKKKRETKYVKLSSLKFISLYERTKELKIVTKDEMLRNFLLVKPHRIVCDFKRDIDIRSYEKAIAKKGVITRVKVGNHNGFYRLVVELDGHYRYSVKDIKGGYLFRFL